MANKNTKRLAKYNRDNDKHFHGQACNSAFGAPRNKKSQRRDADRRLLKLSQNRGK